MIQKIDITMIGDSQPRFMIEDGGRLLISGLRSELLDVAGFILAEFSSDSQPINRSQIDSLVSALAAWAAAAENGVSAGDCGLISKESRMFHDGSAKAYRHAIKLVIEYQRASKEFARESEQCASCMNTSMDSDCVRLNKVSDPSESSAPDTSSPTSGDAESINSNTVISPVSVRTAWNPLRRLLAMMVPFIGSSFRGRSDVEIKS